MCTDAAVQLWQQKMDTVLASDPDSAATRLKWKPSRCGGRALATPSATTTALSASRRRKGATRGSTSLDHIAELAIKGEVGREDGEVLKLLITHLSSATGIALVEADPARGLREVSYVHLASQDPSAPPGRLRMLLRDADEVRRVYAALHGQTIQVGQDTIAIEITNDLYEAARLPGNAQRGRT